jgi:alpha-N-acetylglucosaminidase
VTVAATAAGVELISHLQWDPVPRTDSLERIDPDNESAPCKRHRGAPGHRCRHLLTSVSVAAFVTCLPAAGIPSSVTAMQEMVERIIPEHLDQFTFAEIPPDNGKDVFELESDHVTIMVRGNNAVSMAMGLNWYLKHYCHCHVSLSGDQLDLPAPLPEVQPKVRKVAWARHRYFLNYCSFGYSLPWWDWAQWQRLIDWMALNGINAPLAVTGQEAVWRAVGRKLKFSDHQMTAFLAGPPYLPFGWMGCLDGWGGPLPADWIDRHEQLGKQILARQRALGMTPVLQGFTGHVPEAVAYPGVLRQTVGLVQRAELW